jgi:hypothetical protein
MYSQRHDRLVPKNVELPLIYSSHLKTRDDLQVRLFSGFYKVLKRLLIDVNNPIVLEKNQRI